MIVPIVQEREWEEWLANLPSWRPPLVTTVVVSPHPDDETLGCGGLIRALRNWDVEVFVVAVTDGENAYAGEVGLGAVREAEQREALARLGVDAAHIVRLRMTDSDVSAREAELGDWLRKFVRAGMHVVAPWHKDFHPDHEACGRAAERVCEATGAALSSYFFWTWHRGEAGVLDGLPLVKFYLDDEDVAAKREALAAHVSQLQHVSGEPILPEDLLAPMQRRFEVFLPSGGAA